ncbi:EAL domain-containing protein [Anabaena cylindrica FACHB-243]|uniref:Response regulator receiver modulated diguanylate cyclase/phosphodiesterase n=1 Tax=Anabaena cylindrica (strain ATCC 27899 / PCC 7122) TaxID=272123 RepID=K9ZPZ0_ANACC|nr:MULTISPECIES: EAL domain-containing protein [Anabaena]AFZ60622.1 response regulator receiver modulated diguanylate cyclase/phosphodiesterase [Anabaena cylindrica PCC 7122]MBD2417042.1 EAL domain-containing protein [Anabaena cylindrica FACHB-243]MBY5280371.1 EAL domain-containing protein [Anabaena sp. CCAP 1446/1C]MBY5307606.1 EAL domain-containing protein [Anabaena sp. CCAP 1446/1C]MCM2407190.1 EAL domain-containing protein [Anabaena sp. CCAP 1446/1C]
MSEDLNILIIEDSEVDAMLVLRELRRGGFNPIWERIEVAQELHAALNSRTWDVILSDYRLPGFNAPAALQIVKQSQKDIPFILVSGTIGEVSAVEMMKAGAHDYVMKDNLNRLPEAVRRELRDAQVRAEHKQAHSLLETLASNIPGMIYTFVQHSDGSTAFEYVSLGCLSLLELTPDQVLENISLCFAQIHIDDRAGCYVAAKQSIQTLNQFFYECRLVTPSGQLKWVQASARPELKKNGDTIWHGILLDVSDRKQAQELLIHNALHDPLTNLPNRTLLEERLELAIHRTKRAENYHYAVLFLDLDRFKVINDSLGHLAGDQLLKSIAKKLKTHLREIDLVARLGGDEFVVFLEDIYNLEHAIQITMRILKDFQIPLIINNSEVVISTSIGIVLGTKNYDLAADLLRDADIAMYQAKEKGRNSYKIFDAQMHTQAVNRLTLETEMRKALEREEFIVYYQPIIDIFSSRLIGFEALVRWQHPTRGFILPKEFVPIAEETGLIVPIDQWMFFTACQQLATWKTKFPHRFPLKISINLSVQDIRQDNLIENIDRILKETQLDGESISLEITESMLIENINQTIDLLTKLKLRKNQISIDDFGTGYSSLNYLHRLPADNLKIDRSFVTQMQEGNRNYQVVSTIITLSNQLGLTVVAEGIETLQQLQWLQQLGCEFGQGYLFSKPLAAKEIEICFLNKDHDKFY